MPWQYSPLKSRLMPTIEEAIKAIRTAEAVEERARDPRLLASILTRLPTADPRLAGHIITRRTGIYSFDWRIKPKEDSDADRAENAGRRLTKVIRNLLWNSVDAPLFSYALARLRWSVAGGEWLARVDKRFDPTDIEPDFDSERVRILTHEPRLQRTEAVDTLGETYIHDVVPPMGGILRSILFREILLNMTMQDWANFNRRLKGLTVGRYDEDATPEEQDTVLESVKKIGEANYATGSKAIEFEFVKMVDAIGKDSYKEMKQALEHDVAIAVLGQANTSELPKGGGSRAALQVLDLIRQDIVWSDMMRKETVINDQLIPQDVERNVTQSGDVPYEFEFVVEDREDIEVNARVVTEYVRAGIPVKRDEVYTKVGLTQPEGNDETIERLTPGPSFSF